MHRRQTPYDHGSLFTGVITLIFSRPFQMRTNAKTHSHLKYPPWYRPHRQAHTYTHLCLRWPVLLWEFTSQFQNSGVLLRWKFHRDGVELINTHSSVWYYWTRILHGDKWKALLMYFDMFCCTWKQRKYKPIWWYNVKSFLSQSDNATGTFPAWP